MSAETELPDHEKIKRDLANKFTASSSYLGSNVRQQIMESNFKVLKNVHRPTKIKKGDIITVGGNTVVKSRPAIVVKVLKDRTVLYIPATSTDNVHCMTPFTDRFLKEGCFSRTLSVCTEDYALENFSGVFDNMKALNKAIKDFKEFINTNL